MHYMNLTFVVCVYLIIPSPFSLNKHTVKERMTWLNVDLHKDEFGRKLLDAGVPFDHVHSWANNGHMDVKGESYNAFDVLEDLDSSEVVDLALKAATSATKAK
jgi:hypothetical protein